MRMAPALYASVQKSPILLLEGFRESGDLRMLIDAAPEWVRWTKRESR